jgi:hypothetical protein
MQGHELLLLADGAEEAERVAAEADQRDGRDHDDPEHGALERAAPILRTRRAEQHERQRQAGRDLHADPGYERCGSRAEAWRGACREHERGRQREHDQRVVVGAADGEHEQHGIQADECRRPATRLPEPPGGARDERHGAEAAEHGERLERPHAAGEPERNERVADQREQRAIRRVLVWPAEEREDFVASGLRGDVRVRVEAVKRAQPREADVAEYVLREQRRAE